MSPTVVVVGSCNIDLVTRTERLPRRGETVAGSLFGTFLGGKGLNQAVAARRMGARVGMLARVGDDTFGRQVSQALHHEEIEQAHVIVDDTAGTGTATILVEHNSGDNVIIVVPGANGSLSASDVDAAGRLLAGARVVLLQLEIPIETVVRAAELARAAGATVLLTPAPARELPDRLLALVDVLLPNQTELATLLGDEHERSSGRPEPVAGARRLLDRGCGAVLLTLGEQGAMLVTPEGEQAIQPFRVSAVDTVAAGDAFAGTLAALLAEDELLDKAAHWAAAAGALAVTREGALPSLPRRAEVEQLIARAG